MLNATGSRPGWPASPGKRIDFPGLQGTITDVLVRVELLDGRNWTTIVHPSQPWVEITAAQTRVAVMGTFVVQGIRHILFGADHLLFVLGLLLIVKDRWMLLKTVTAFTVAHSITLAIATLGYAEAPVLPLNAAIALSILFLGPEIVRSWRGETSFTIRHPVGGRVCFRLAAWLRIRQCSYQRGLPKAEFPILAAVFQRGSRDRPALSFVALILATGARFRILQVRWPRWAEALPGYTVGSLGAFWTVQRLASSSGHPMTRKPRQEFHRVDGGLTAIAVIGARRAFAHVQKGEAAGFLTGLQASGLRPRSRALDGRRRTVGSTAWRSCGMAAAGRISHGDGFWRHAWSDGRALAGIENGIAASAIMLGMAVMFEFVRRSRCCDRCRIFRDFPWSRSRHRTASRPERVLYSMGFVMATGLLHARRYRYRNGASLGVGQGFSGCRGDRSRGWNVLYVEGVLA